MTFKVRRSSQILGRKSVNRLSKEVAHILSYYSCFLLVLCAFLLENLDGDMRESFFRRCFNPKINCFKMTEYFLILFPTVTIVRFSKLAPLYFTKNHVIELFCQVIITGLNFISIKKKSYAIIKNLKKSGRVQKIQFFGTFSSKQKK